MGCDDYPFYTDDTELEPPNTNDSFPYHPNYFRAIDSDSSPSATKYTSSELTEPKTNHDKGSASAYTFDNYQDDASTTAIYPGAGTGSDTALSYVLLKLCAEAGELGQAYAKYLRGDYDYAEFVKRAYKEIGDVTWYASQAATEINAKFGDTAADNIRKLNDRKQRGVIKGSGDDR